MKQLQFNIMNGEVVEAGSLPAYRITLNWRMKVVKLESCFSMDNIKRNGEEWKNERLKQEKEYFDKYIWIKKSLRKFIWKNIFKKHNISIPEWFVYLSF